MSRTREECAARAREMRELGYRDRVVLICLGVLSGVVIDARARFHRLRLIATDAPWAHGDVDER